MHPRVYEARRRLDRTVEEFGRELASYFERQGLSNVQSLVDGVMHRLEHLRQRDEKQLAGEADLIPLSVGQEVAEVRQFREQLEWAIKALKQSG